MSFADREESFNDSLPYIDTTNEEYEEDAAKLVEEEMKRLVPRKVQALPELRFRSPLMETEVRRLGENRKTGTTTSVLLEDPPVEAPTENTVEVWQEAVRRSKIAYEKERIRNMLLEICKEGSTAAEQWKQMNAQLETMKLDLEKSLQEQKTRVDAINLQRQTDQEQKGQELHVLLTQYANLIDKTYQLKQAIAEIENELGKEGDGEQG